MATPGRAFTADGVGFVFSWVLRHRSIGEKHTGHDRFSYPAGISKISHKYWRCVSYAHTHSDQYCIFLNTEHTHIHSNRLLG